MGNFKMWLETKRIYNTRFDPEDAKIIKQRPLPPPENEEVPKDRSMIGVETWQKAYDNTLKRVTSSYPPEIKEASRQIWNYLVKNKKQLFEIRPELRCSRCKGAGFKDDDEHWIMFQHGKMCLRCNGAGIDPNHHPVYRRRFTIDHILDKIKRGNVQAVQQWADKVVSSSIEEQPYKPILMDVVQLVQKGQLDQIVKLPH
jgi:hypothetical protein